MISQENLAKFIRYYANTYRLEHDIDWRCPDTSYWSYELAVQPTTPAQLPLLRKIFRGKDLQIDEATGKVNCRAPFLRISEAPTLAGMIDCFQGFCGGLTGSKFQIQILIANKDDELREGLNREQQWQWLVSSMRLCELFLLGNIAGDDMVFDRVYHSCHQADQNRDLTEECPTIIQQWERCYREIAMSHYIMPFDAEDLLKVLKVEMQGASHSVHTYECDSDEEARAIADLCKMLGVYKAREVQVEGNKITSKLGIVELSDILFSRRKTNTYHLFGSEPVEE